MAISPRERIAAAVRDFLAFLERKDIDSWIRLWDPDGEQYYPYGTEMFPPHIAGRDAVHERWKSLPDMFESLSFPLLELWIDGDTAIARFDGHLVKKDGTVYRNNYICTFTFTEAGLISRYREYFDPILAGAAFGLAETTYLTS